MGLYKIVNPGACFRRLRGSGFLIHIPGELSGYIILGRGGLENLVDGDDVRSALTVGLVAHPQDRRDALAGDREDLLGPDCGDEELQLVERDVPGRDAADDVLVLGLLVALHDKPEGLDPVDLGKRVSELLAGPDLLVEGRELGVGAVHRLHKVTHPHPHPAGLPPLPPLGEVEAGIVAGEGELTKRALDHSNHDTFSSCEIRR